MLKVDYLKIIHKYIKPNSAAYRFYIPHVVLVTVKATHIGRKMGLSSEKVRFIEEASMLHDIGIIKTKDEEIGCNGKAPYICHILEGQKILEKEGLPKHALVARTHIGVGITKDEVISNKLPLPQEDFIARTVEEEIISYADLFYSKNPKIIWQEKSFMEVRKDVSRFGVKHTEILNRWHKKFGD
ncbi:MAG: HD domain-containing protein [bacterium]